MNFKKRISLFLAIFLLVSNMGFAVDVHYCGEKIASIKPNYWKTSEAVKSKEKSCCPPKTTTIASKKDNCCKDKVVHFQKKSGKITFKSISFQPFFIILNDDWKPIIFPEQSSSEGDSITSYYCDSNAPPLFKLYQQYIFYA